MTDGGWSAMSEDDLVGRARAGSQDAMVELYRRHRGLVIGYVLRMTGDPDLADEIFAATFVAFFARLDRYRSRGHLGAYLLRIARGKLADEIRARDRLGRRRGAMNSGWSPPSEPIDPSPEPSETIASAELAVRAERALMGLPDTLREVVVLRLYEGLDYKAIASIVDVGEATVRSRMRYALRSLRKSLDPSRET
jgi:RNA polymerase sigma-70 factor (ECF subfamily)